MLSRNYYRLLIQIGQHRRSYSLTSQCAKELRFSETSAYHGQKSQRSRAVDLNEPLYIPNKYDSSSFRIARALSAVFSLFALTIYLAFIREPNDLDLILESEPYIISGGLQRRYITQQINQARTTGQPTELLQAELDYVDVQEETVKQEYAKKLRAEAKKQK